MANFIVETGESTARFGFLDIPQRRDRRRKQELGHRVSQVFFESAACGSEGQGSGWRGDGLKRR